MALRVYIETPVIQLLPWRDTILAEVRAARVALRAEAGYDLDRLSTGMGGGIPTAEILMKCVHCRGELARRTAPLHVDRGGCHVVLDAVPAWVCQQCGEPYFEEREVDAIQNLVRSVEENAKRITAP